jgi:hypothetical protein
MADLTNASKITKKVPYVGVFHFEMDQRKYVI